MDVSKIMLQVRQEYENGLAFKQGRVSDWQATEDLYYGKAKKTLKGRFNVPMPVMSGYIDTLISKLDDAPSLKFRAAEEADFRVAQKEQALWDATIKNSDNDFESKDLDVKKLAAFYGRGIFKVYGESLNGFVFNIKVTDPYDFYVDPVAGGSLDDARYLGEDNIFISKTNLIAGANDGYYNKNNVTLLINGLAENTVQSNDNIRNNKANRLNALGLTNTTYNFMGEGTMKFIETGTIFNGERFYVLWNYDTNLPIRCVPIKENFISGLWWWVSWATHRDSFNFWSKAPADDIRPIAETIKILANQELDNRQKKNWGMRAYDPEMFPNGAELEYRPNGLVAVRSGASKVQQIASGIYEFQTPELNGTINLINWLDNLSGQKSGVTAATQGVAEEQKVGIYEGNMQQVSDRLGLYNKSCVKAYVSIGRRFLWAGKEHLKQPAAVRLIGEKGVEWDKLSAKEINPTTDVFVESSSAQMQINAMKKERRSQAITLINSNPALANAVNQKWRIEQILLNGEFSDEEVRVALDTQNDGNRDVMAKASSSIQEILDGKQPKLFRGATTGFMQKIIDFALDNTDGDLDLYKRLMAYAEAHTDIVIENMSRNATATLAKNGGIIPGMEAPGMGMADLLGQKQQQIPNMPATPEVASEDILGPSGGQQYPMVQ